MASIRKLPTNELGYGEVGFTPTYEITFDYSSSVSYIASYDKKFDLIKWLRENCVGSWQERFTYYLFELESDALACYLTFSGVEF